MLSEFQECEELRRAALNQTGAQEAPPIPIAPFPGTSMGAVEGIEGRKPWDVL